MQYAKIPEERTRVLIGEGGKTKRYIEKKTKTKIEIEEELITIDGESNESASLHEWVAKDIVLAIGRGFNPAAAMKLLNENYMLAVIPLRDFAHTKKASVRIKGRIIGEGGRTRKFVEQTTGCYVSVYGKTVALIGIYDDVPIAKEAVVMLLEGSPHSSVYKFLERKRQEQLEDRRRAMSW